MTTFTAAITTASDCVLGDFCDVSVAENEIITYKLHEDGTETPVYGMSGKVVMDAVETTVRTDASDKLGQIEADAERILAANGWKIVGSWSWPTPPPTPPSSAPDSNTCHRPRPHPVGASRHLGRHHDRRRARVAHCHRRPGRTHGSGRQRHARELAEIADDRALVIARAVAEHGRGGREHVAALLKVSVGRVDKAIARAKGASTPSHLPSAEETLELLYAAELAEMPPLAETQWRILASLVQTLVIDGSWIESGPGPLLAAEYAEASEDGDVPADGHLVEQIQSWSRSRTLAVIEALSRPGIEDLA